MGQDSGNCGCKDYSLLTANLGIATLLNGTSALDGSGAIVPIFTAGNANGSFVKCITVKALQSTNPGMIRLYVSPPGGSPQYILFQEKMVVETTQSSFDASMKFQLEQNFNIPAGYIIGASTQIGQSFAFTVEGWDWTYPIS